MRRFSQLYDALDRTTSTNAKVTAMVEYFGDAPSLDAAWAVFFLSGERLRRPVKTRTMAAWATELAGITDWMFEASYSAVGDLAETIALLVDSIPHRDVPEPWDPPLHEAVEWVKELRGLDEEVQRERVLTVWAGLEPRDLYLLMKLMTGALRVGVSKRLVVRALTEYSGVDRATIFHRMMGHWEPSARAFERLFEEGDDVDLSRPYPYFLASPLEAEPESLGAPRDWQAEWKWDGIRGQLIRRDGETFLWSRGEELVNHQYPEVIEAASHLPDGTVLDGELLAWDEAAGVPLPFSQMQRRIGRKKVGKKMLSSVPVAFMVYDQIEKDGADFREASMAARRAALEATVRGLEDSFPLSPIVGFDSWAELAELRGESRERRVEGVMLKRLDSPYRVGRTRGDWWKWKVEPFEIDAVLIYAQPGHGRRAGLHTDYTFALWDDGELVTVAKAYSGLSNEEIRELDTWIRRNTVEKYGPVRAVEPTHVFQLHFENVAPSNRHKSGFAVRFPRIARWRRDKPIEQADSLDRIRAIVRVAQDA